MVCVQYFYSIILETFSSAFRLMCSIMFIFTTKTFLLQPSLKNFSPKKIESWNIGLPRKNVLIKPSNTAYSKDQPIKLWLGSKKKVILITFFYFFSLRKVPSVAPEHARARKMPVRSQFLMLEHTGCSIF